MITAPFNFVPLNEKIFYPPWAEDISHDIPFEDGESGVIDITITAKSPIFIRDSKNETEFCNHNGEYYIPSTSVKGMIRNVLEIMSFSKLSESQFTDNTYAVRDLSKANNFYMTQMKEETYCGWLKKDGDDYIIEDCGVPLRIHHNQIDYALNIQFAKYFNSTGFEKTSEYKYNLIGGNPKRIKVSKSYKSATNAKYDSRLFCKYQQDGDEGTLVVTGQPTARENTGEQGDGKGFEFIFFDKKKDIILDDKSMKDFLFAYFDKRTTQPKESPDWNYWKEKLYKGEKVPVFFQKNGSKIAHFGLSYLYKLPYKHSIKDGIFKEHITNDDLDMAQSIFGYINKKDALKGRVSFSHFKATENIKQLDTRTEILGTPRASYYPIYVKQYGKEFKTFMDSSFSIAGRKRYPIHKGNKTKNTKDTGNENVGTAFTPLKDGVTFKGKLRYHNLKKGELGAILSALTFHNTPNTYHNIGLAKSLGYGKISIKINNFIDIKDYLKEFEMILTKQILNWKSSISLQELLSMSIEQSNSGDSKLEYMKLEDFAKNKTGDEITYLKCYTELNNIASINIKSLLTQNEIDNLKIENVRFEQEQIIKKEKKKQQETYDNDWKNIQKSTNIAQIESFINKYKEYSIHIEQADNLIKNIQKQQQKELSKKLEKDIEDKWNIVQNTEHKYKQSAVENFILKYPDSQYIAQANHLLEEFTTKTNAKLSKSLDNLKNTNNSKEFRNILDDNEENLSSNKPFIKNEAIRVYTSLKGKKQKNFFKEIQLGRFLGNDFENDIKNEVLK
jgi:CRISPR-associated protein (TIGR03986 family)